MLKNTFGLLQKMVGTRAVSQEEGRASFGFYLIIIVFRQPSIS
ncbi:MAG: hypothetical protein AAF632_23030 [Bacteroidota bacterium]